MLVEMSEKEYKAYQKAKAVILQSQRVELIPTKDDVRVIHVQRKEVKASGKI